MRLSGGEPAVPCRVPPQGTSTAGQSSGAGLGRDPNAVTAVPHCPGQLSPVTFIFCRNNTLLGISVGAEGPRGVVWSR